MSKPIIVTNATVLTCDANNRCGRYNIMISAGRIVDISERLDLLTKDRPDALMIDAKGKLITPGFVNAHYHSASFLLREATTGLHFGLWKDDARFGQAVAKLTHPTSEDDVRRIYRAAYLAHVKSGTTCVGEFPPALDESSFLTMLEGIESTGIVSVVTLRNWDQIRKAQALGAQSVRTVVSLGEEGEFTVYSFEHLSKAAKELRSPLLAHIAETREDVEVIRRNFQRDGITVLAGFNVLNPNTIIVHANYISEDEVQTLKGVNGTVVVTPQSTAAKQTGYPSLRNLAKHNVRLALGSDWGNAEMMQEMRFVRQLPFVVPGLRFFTATEVLRMTTINGAVALGIGGELGSIEVRKRADLLFFEVADIRLPVVLTNSSEAWSRLLVEHLSTGDITDVMVKGEFRVRNREMTEAGEETVSEEFRALLGKYFASSPAPVKQTAKTNVLPFLAERSAAEIQDEGFETGYSPSSAATKIHDIADTPEPARPLGGSAKSKREALKPELPKDTRRVFGDDEEF